MKPNGQPLTIFYTDDDPDDQDLFKEVVSEIKQDYNVYTQNHGGELIALLKNPPPEPHLIFLDLNMPVKNGFEVLKEMRDSTIPHRIPVIVFSTSDDKEAIELTKKLGADLFIPKPTSYNKLKETIKKVLSFDWVLLRPSEQDFIYHV